MAEPPAPASETQQAPKFTEFNDLLNERVGGKVIFATDDWFAAAENLIKSEDAVFDPAAFTPYGKLMDGWESRRRRLPGHDWCILQLGAPGVVYGVDIDTGHFTGNYAPKVSIQAAAIDTDLPARSANRMGTAASDEERRQIDRLGSESWTDIVPSTEMRPGYKTSQHNYFSVSSRQRWTHLRLNMYPDGGIARLRVYGQVVPDWSSVSANKLVDLAAMLSGGVCIGYSNVHFGHARNMIGPGRSEVMADGWETARRLDRPAVLTVNTEGILQVPGSEWAVFKLGHPGTISKIEIDTNHFKGNFPSSCWIEACNSPERSTKIPAAGWTTLLPTQKLSAHQQHYYGPPVISNAGVVSHVRVSMAPDGGISRMRLWGHIAAGVAARL